MSPQVRSIVDAHREAQARVHAVASALPGAAFNQRPDPGAWAVAECVEHLNRAAEGWLGRIEPAVAEGARRAAGPFTYGFVARKLIEGVAVDGPPLTTGRRLDPAAGDPSGERSALDRAATLAAFDGYTDRLVAACERADGLDLARIKVRYPFGPLLRLPLGAALEITGLHALRHAAQAERAAREIGARTP